MNEWAKIRLLIACSWLDRQRSDNVGSGLNIFSMAEKIMEYRCRHKTNKNCIPKQMSLYKTR